METICDLCGIVLELNEAHETEEGTLCEDCYLGIIIKNENKDDSNFTA